MDRIDALLATLTTQQVVPLLTALAAFLVMIALVLWLRPRHTAATRARAPDPTDARALMAAPAPETAAELTAALAKVQLDPRPLLDREELRLLPFLERAVRDFGRGHRLAVQVPASLLLHPRHGAASTDRNQRVAAALDVRRLTFAVLDRQTRLSAALFLGAGPEPVLSQALQLAAVPVVVLGPDWTPEQIKARLRDTLTGEVASEAEPLLSALTGRKPAR
jgi:hypothetical protein